jgi:hypothetical protein
MGVYAAFGCSQAVFSFFMGSTFALLTFFASQRLHKVFFWIWHCSFMHVCGLTTAFRMQSNESCTPQCHSLRLLCVLFRFIFEWIPHAWKLASWSYYEPFRERCVYLANSIRTAFGVDLTQLLLSDVDTVDNLLGGLSLSITSIRVTTKHHGFKQTRFACLLQHSLRS